MQKPGKRSDPPYNKKVSIWRCTKKCPKPSGQSFSPSPSNRQCPFEWTTFKKGASLKQTFFLKRPSPVSPIQVHYLTKVTKDASPTSSSQVYMATPHQCAGLRLSQEVSAKPNRFCCCCRRASRFKFQNIHSLWISSMRILTKNLKFGGPIPHL